MRIYNSRAVNEGEGISLALIVLIIITILYLIYCKVHTMQSENLCENYIPSISNVVYTNIPILEKYKIEDKCYLTIKIRNIDHEIEVDKETYEGDSTKVSIKGTIVDNELDTLDNIQFVK